MCHCKLERNLQRRRYVAQKQKTGDMFYLLHVTYDLELYCLNTRKHIF